MREKRVAVLGLLTGAVVWGLIWYPYRALERGGMGGMEAVTLSYLVALLFGLPLLRGRLRRVEQPGLLLAIALAGAACNIGYVHATLHGVVVRVLLLFYLAPLWTVLLARVLLAERVGVAGTGVVALSLAGAATMLWHPQQGVPLPVNGAEWTGLVAGFLFALSNVLIRKAHGLDIEIKTLAVFAGAVVLGPLLMALDGSAHGLAVPLPAHLWLVLVILGLVLLAVNLVVQFGLMRISAARAIVIMLFELVVAALAAWVLEGEGVGPREWLGGAMIVAASVLSGRLEARAA